MYKVVSYYQEDPMAIANFHKDARYLLSEYHFYIRNIILSILNGSTDISEIVSRLDRNQTEIGSMLTPYYPMETSIALVDLLKTHIKIVAEYISASKAKQDLVTIQTQWVANTDEIASILNSIDSVRWPKAAVVTYLTQNANYIHRQLVARMASDWATDIESQDLAYKNIIDFADTLSNGIVMNNLEKFSK